MQATEMLPEQMKINNMASSKEIFLVIFCLFFNKLYFFHGTVKKWGDKAPLAPPCPWSLSLVLVLWSEGPFLTCDLDNPSSCDKYPVTYCINITWEILRQCNGSKSLWKLKDFTLSSALGFVFYCSIHTFWIQGDGHQFGTMDVLITYNVCL